MSNSKCKNSVLSPCKENENLVVNINKENENIVFNGNNEKENKENGCVQNNHTIEDVIYDKLRILSLNVCGLVSKLKNPDFVEFITAYDIICLTETKLDQYDEVDILEGFTLLSTVNREFCKAKSGGICIFVRENLCKYVSVKNQFTGSSHCTLWFEIDDRLLFNETLFGVIYIPPENSLYSDISMFDDIEDVLINVDSQVCLLGDFNAHTSNVNEYIVY